MKIKKRFWIWMAAYGLPLVVLLVILFIGFVKAAAWWRVAFGSCYA